MRFVFRYIFIYIFLLFVSQKLIAQDTLNTPLDTTQNIEEPSSPINKPPSDTVILKFIKYKTTQTPDSIYFNVLKIINYKTETVKGKLNVYVPEGWSFIALPFTNINLAPGDSLFLPISIGIPANVSGDLAYVINATLNTDKQEMFYANSYVNVPRKRKWSIRLDKHLIYFNEYHPKVNFKLHLKNEGNGTEVIKLDFRIGKLLRIDGFNKNKNIQYVELKAYADTTITYYVEYIAPKADESYLEYMWKETLIRIIASNSKQTKSERLWFKKLKSEYWNIRDEYSSPLNVDISLMHLISNIQPRMNLWFFGNILLPKNRDIKYFAMLRNIFLNPKLNDNFNIGNYSYFTFLTKYSDNKLSLELGDIRSTLFSSVGFGIARSRGINAKYKINDKHTVMGMIGNDFTNNIFSTAAGYSTIIKNKIPINAGISYLNDNFLKFKSYSVFAGGSYSFIPRHLISGSIILNRSKFDLSKFSSFTPNSDTTTLGFGYSLNYSTKYENFRINITNTNFLYTKNYNNYNTWRINADYKLTKKYRLNFLLNRNSVFYTTYPEAFYKKNSFFKYSVLRATFGNRVSPVFFYQVGPEWYYVKRKQFLANDIDNFTLLSQFTALYGAIRYRFNENESLSISNTIGVTNAINSDTLTFLNPFDFDTVPPFPVFSSRTSVYFRSKYWQLMILYNNGPSNTLSQFTYLNRNQRLQTLQIRPTFEKYFKKNTMRFYSYASYILRIPTNREHLNFYGEYDIYMKKGWQLRFIGNYYLKKVQDREYNIFRNRFFSLSVGARKSFDIQQPRIKYYDLTIVCFKDNNGNKVFDKEELPLANIMINIERDRSDTLKTNFSQVELITDPNGEIKYHNLPQGIYNITFTPLVNLKDLYNVNGNVQKVVVGSNITYYVPYSKTFTVMGSIILERDKFSNAGVIDLGNIRITAKSLTDGSTYSTLTDGDGNYLLNIPQSGQFKISINNVFGENFIPERDMYVVDFNGYKSYKVDFKFIEKRRGINIQGDTGYEFKFFKEETEKVSTKINESLPEQEKIQQEEINKQEKESVVGEIAGTQENEKRLQEDSLKMDTLKSMKDYYQLDSLVGEVIGKLNENKLPANPDPKFVRFKVQVGIYSKDLSKSAIQKLLPFGEIFREKTSSGKFRYTSGLFDSYEEAVKHAEKLRKAGFKGAFVVGDYKNITITVQKAKEILGK